MVEIENLGNSVKNAFEGKKTGRGRSLKEF